MPLYDVVGSIPTMAWNDTIVIAIVKYSAEETVVKRRRQDLWVST